MDLRNQLIAANYCQTENHLSQLQQFGTNLQSTAVDVNPYVMWLSQSCSMSEIICQMMRQMPVRCAYILKKGKHAGHQCLQNSNYATRAATIKCETLDAAVGLLNPYCAQHRKYWDLALEKPKLQKAIEKMQKEKRARMRDVLLMREHSFRGNVQTLKKMASESMQTLNVLQVLDIHGVVLPEKYKKSFEILQNLLQEKQWQDCFDILSATTQRVCEPSS